MEGLSKGYMPGRQSVKSPRWRTKARQPGEALTSDEMADLLEQRGHTRVATVFRVLQVRPSTLRNISPAFLEDFLFVPKDNVPEVFKSIEYVYQCSTQRARERQEKLESQPMVNRGISHQSGNHKIWDGVATPFAPGSSRKMRPSPRTQNSSHATDVELGRNSCPELPMCGFDGRMPTFNHSKNTSTQNSMYHVNQLKRAPHVKRPSVQLPVPQVLLDAQHFRTYNDQPFQQNTSALARLCEANNLSFSKMTLSALSRSTLASFLTAWVEFLKADDPESHGELVEIVSYFQKRLAMEGYKIVANLLEDVHEADFDGDLATYGLQNPFHRDSIRGLLVELSNVLHAPRSPLVMDEHFRPDYRRTKPYPGLQRASNKENVAQQRVTPRFNSESTSPTPQVPVLEFREVIHREEVLGGNVRI